jgi:uncharacterized protein (TIGR04222 family)
MNPFDLPGPEFLFFYAVFATVVVTAAYLLTRQREGMTVPKIGFDDPYRIAFLRGGKNDALRIATFSLIDRGLLDAKEDRVCVTRDDAAELVRHPLEKAVLSHFRTEADATSIFTATTLARSCDEFERDLTGLGLLPDAAENLARSRRAFVAAFALLGVATVKVGVALSRGRSNVWFLVILCAVAVYGAYKATHPFRTTRGSALLADVRAMLAGLKDRSAFIQPGGVNNEAALLAAVFGIGALPEKSFPYLKRLYPKAASSSSSGSVCGAACGSSCGGGCGGGCGGCGG